MLLTEWNAYRGLDLAAVAQAMAGNVFVDLRNVFEREVAEAAGLVYGAVGPRERPVLTAVEGAGS